MRPDHAITKALLDACGVPSDRVRSVVYRSPLDEPATLDVEYIIVHGDSRKVAIAKTVRFAQVADDE